jgi:hypothetical protein
MAENINQEKNHQYYLDKIYEVDHEVYYGMGKYTQFTIDLVEEIREELNNQSAGYKKALRWNGLLWAIQDMAKEDYDLDRDADIRLVFVRSC